MPAIYSKDWYEAMVAFANGQKNFAKKMPGGEWRFAVELNGDGLSPYVPEGTTKHFFIRFMDGKVEECRETEGPVPGKQLNYRITGPANVFEGIAAGIVDPVEAGLGGALAIRGDMRVLMQNADMANVIFDIYKQTSMTEWPKGKPPYQGR